VQLINYFNPDLSILFYGVVSFSVLMLLVGRQKGHLACRTTATTVFLAHNDSMLALVTVFMLHGVCTAISLLFRVINVAWFV